MHLATGMLIERGAQNRAVLFQNIRMALTQPLKKLR
jgi:hypothetical protein